MQVITEINPHKINGELVKVGNTEILKVRNVWNYPRLVELDFGGNKIEIHETDLLKAIKNATDNERY